MFPLALLLAEIAGAALPLAHSVKQSIDAANNPDDEELQREKPGVLTYAADIGSGLTGLGLVRGGLGAAKLAAEAAKMAGKGALRQSAAGFGSLAKTAVSSPASLTKAGIGASAGSSMDDLIRQYLQKHMQTPDDSVIGPDGSWTMQ